MKLIVFFLSILRQYYYPINFKFCHHQQMSEKLIKTFILTLTYRTSQLPNRLKHFILPDLKVIKLNLLQH